MAERRLQELQERFEAQHVSLTHASLRNEALEQQVRELEARVNQRDIELARTQSATLAQCELVAQLRSVLASNQDVPAAGDRRKRQRA